MKLSEAIRLGAMMNPQCFGALMVSDVLTGRTKSTCAIGAALKAGYDLIMLRQAHRGAYECPAPQCAFDVRTLSPTGRLPLEALIVHLNDNHRWTRERIADWVEAVVEQPAPVLVETLA